MIVALFAYSLTTNMPVNRVECYFANVITPSEL